MPGYPLPQMPKRRGGFDARPGVLVFARNGRVVRPAGRLFRAVKAGSYRLMAGVVSVGLLPVQG